MSWTGISLQRTGSHVLSYSMFCLHTFITHNSTVITLQLLSKPPIQFILTSTVGNSEQESRATTEMFPADLGNSEQEDGSSDSSQTFSLSSEQSKTKKRRCESEAMQGGSSAVSMNDREEVIQQLVEKFHSTTVRSERLTVLTAVPIELVCT